MDWQFKVLVHCNGVPESCIVVPNHLQTYFRILQQNRVAFIFYLFISPPHTHTHTHTHTKGVKCQPTYRSTVGFAVLIGCGSMSPEAPKQRKFA